MKKIGIKFIYIFYLLASLFSLSFSCTGIFLVAIDPSTLWVYCLNFVLSVLLVASKDECFAYFEKHIKI